MPSAFERRGDIFFAHPRWLARGNRPGHLAKSNKRFHLDRRTRTSFIPLNTVAATSLPRDATIGMIKMRCRWVRYDAAFQRSKARHSLLDAGCSIAVVLVGPLYRSEWLSQMGAA